MVPLDNQKNKKTSLCWKTL